MAKIFNISKKLALCFCCVIALVFGFAGCGSGFSTFTDNPASSDVVTGNGSLAVTKGNYIYFANGFKGYSDVTEGLNGNTEYATLYRAKVDASGHVVENEKKLDEDNNEIFDETQGIQNVDILCKKIVGFENMGLFIFGNYIYFATPNDEKSVVSGTLTLRTDLIDICRTKIDRSSAVEKVYTTENVNTSCAFTMVQDGNETNLIIVDGTKIVIKKINGDSIKSSKIITEKNTSYALPKYSRSDVEISALDKDLYFTRDIDSTLDSDKNLSAGNVMMKCNLATLETSIVRSDGKTSFTLKQTNGKYLYVEETYKESYVDYTSLIYAFENPSTDSVRGTQISAMSYTSFTAINPDLGMGILASDGTNVYCKNIASERYIVYTGSVTFVDVVASDVYFLVDSKIYKINYSSALETAKNLTESTTPYASEAKYVCVNGTKIFYLNTYTNADSKTSYYLHMIDTQSVEEGVMYDHFIGVLMPQDYLTAPSAEE